MSLNQLTQNSEKKWMIAKTFDLTVDGNIRLTNPNSREGDILTCTDVDKAEFVPVNINPTLSSNYYTMSSGGLQVIPTLFTFTAVGSTPDFTLSPNTTLTCNNTGTYWITKKITLDATSNGGFESRTLVNSVSYPYATLTRQQVIPNVSGYGLTTSFLVELTAGDTIQESVAPTVISYQNDQSRPTTNMTLIKIA